MKTFTTILSVLALMTLSSCSSNPNVRKGQIGGAAVGGVATGLLTNSWHGAAVGAAVGGLVGGELKR